MSTIRAREPGWADVLEDHAADWATARRLVGQLGACEAAALAFCRLLERWARGDAYPSTAGAREAALRHAADRAETALTGLDHPLDRYLLELEADRAEGRSWYGGPGAGELIARGFTGPDELITEMRAEATRVLDECLSDDISEIKLLQEHLHDAVGQLVYDRTHRRPMILPVIVEV